MDCPWLFQRKKVEQQAEDIEVLQELIQALVLGDNTKRESRGSSVEELREGGGEKMNTWDDASA